MSIAAADVRIVKLEGAVLEGRFYDLGNEYLELDSRLGSTLILKREVKGWSPIESEKPEPSGIILVLQGGHEVAGNVRVDAGTREGVVDLELGSAR